MEYLLYSLIFDSTLIFSPCCIITGRFPTLITRGKKRFIRTSTLPLRSSCLSVDHCILKAVKQLVIYLHRQSTCAPSGRFFLMMRCTRRSWQRKLVPYGNLLKIVVPHGKFSKHTYVVNYDVTTSDRSISYIFTDVNKVIWKQSSMLTGRSESFHIVILMWPAAYDYTCPLFKLNNLTCGQNSKLLDWLNEI